jgi:hypothetical protein
VTGNTRKHKSILKTELGKTNGYITEEGIVRSKPEGLTNPYSKFHKNI